MGSEQAGRQAGSRFLKYLVHCGDKERGEGGGEGRMKRLFDSSG